MNTSKAIQEKKDLFDLPFHRDQLEYWGPLDHTFANSFLTMGDAFLKQFFGDNNAKALKPIFSSFVELVQNVSEYNEEEYDTADLPQSYINLRIENEFVVINTVNKIKDKDVDDLEKRLEDLFSSSEDELAEQRKDMLMGGGSLGFIMVKRLKNAEFEYNFKKGGNDENWLSLELKINYGSITD